MQPDDPRHGTLAGYGTGCRCQPCRDARYRWTKNYTFERDKGRTRTKDSTGTIRRIHALQALGWSMPEIAARGGWASYQSIHQATLRKRVTHRFAHRIDVVYRELSMLIPPETPASKRALTWARRNGYAPPLAWDDIDDINETPCTTTSSSSTRRSSSRREYVDQVVVDRLLRGERIFATREEQEETVRRIIDNPERTLVDFAAMSHLPVRSIAERLHKRARRAAWAS